VIFEYVGLKQTDQNRSTESGIKVVRDVVKMTNSKVVPTRHRV
jgi:hypothetical protein